MGLFLNKNEFNDFKNEETKKNQEMINQLRNELRDLKNEIITIKHEVNKPTVIDEETKRELKDIMLLGAKGINSYKPAIYGLYAIVIILAVAILLNAYKLNEVAENMDWKYDVVTSILSNDRHYWFDGENYQVSRNAPETKRLEEAQKRYNEISNEIKNRKNVN